MDLISVIVPVFKVEQYLNRCVESIVNQTYKNLEIILVDDGSPDDCPTICDTWAKKNSGIKVIHKTNGGLSDARNAGLVAATGQYIAFVDSDDWIQKTFIDYLYRAITNTGADLSACDVRFVPDGEEVSDSTEPFGTVQTCLPEEAIGELLKGFSFRDSKVMVPSIFCSSFSTAFRAMKVWNEGICIATSRVATRTSNRASRKRNIFKAVFI